MILIQLTARRPIERLAFARRNSSKALIAQFFSLR